MNTRVVQKAFIRNASGKYLFLKRSDYGARPNEWDLPGGRLDPGETLHEAIVREIREESGIDDIKNERVVYAKSDIRADEQPSFNYVLLLYIADTDSDEVTLSHEHQDLKWLSLREAHDLVQHPLHKEAILRIIDNDLE